MAAAFPMVERVGSNPDLGAVVIQDFTHVVSSIFQYLIPVGFLIGAVGGALRRRRRRT